MIMEAKKYYSINPFFNSGGIGSGFFSNYRICLEKLIQISSSTPKGLPANMIPYINWANTTFVDGFNPIIENGNIMPGGDMPIDITNNPFNLWFDQEDPYKLGVNDQDIIISPTGRCSYRIDHAQNYFNNPTELKIQQTIDNLYIKPKQYILDKVNEIYEREFKNHVVLGVMARGSEFTKWHGHNHGQSGVTHFKDKINKILKSHPEITKLLLVSDESKYIEILHKSFPSSYFVPNIFRRTDETTEYINSVICWMNVSTKRKNHCKLLGEETIIQTKLLSKCNYLLGNGSGIVAGAVLWNENIQKIYGV